MPRQVSLFLVLLVFWCLLSGQVDLRHSADLYLFGCGVFCCALVTYLASRKDIVDEEGHPIHLAWRSFSYLPWLFRQIVISNIDVAKRVWHPRRPIAPRLVRVPYETKTDLATVIYANSITLTPGTITVIVDTEKREILVHALSAEAEAGLREMHDRVVKLEDAD